MPMVHFAWPGRRIAVLHLFDRITEDDILGELGRARTSGVMRPGIDRLIITHPDAAMAGLDFATLERIHAEVLAYERSAGPPAFRSAHLYSSPMHLGMVEAYVMLWEMAGEPGISARAFGEMPEALAFLGLPPDATPPFPEGRGWR